MKRDNSKPGVAIEPGFFDRLISYSLTILKKPLVFNANYLFGVNIVTALGGLVFWTIVSRLQTPSSVGLASTILSSVSLLSGISGLGMGFGILRFLPTSKSPTNLLNSVFNFCTICSCVVAIVYLESIRLWADKLLFLTGSLIYMVGFVSLVAISTLIGNLQSTFLVRRLAIYLFMYTLIVNVVRILLVLAFNGQGAAWIVGVVAASISTGTIVGYFYFLPRAQTAYRIGFKIDFLEIKKILPYSFGNYVSSLLELNTQAIVFLLVLEISGAAASGYATIAWTIGAMILSPGVAWIGSAFAESSNRPEAVATILIKASIPALILTVLAALVAGIGAPFWLSIFGESYSTQASGFLRVLAVASPFMVIVDFYCYYLRVIKRIGLLVLLDLSQTIFIVGMSYFLMNRFGIAIIGIAFLIANGIVAIPVAFRAIGIMSGKD